MRPAVAEKTEIYCARAQYRRGGSPRDPTENAKCDSRGGMFSAFVGVHACRVDPETRHGGDGARKGSVTVVAEKTEIYCALAQNRRGGTRPKTKSVIHAAECFRPLLAFRHVESVRKHEMGLERGRRLLRKLRFTVLVHRTGEEGPD